MDFEFFVPSYISEIINRLESKGYEAYIVGGAVRDTLIGREIYDYDLTTNALPDTITNIFYDYNLIDIGSKFGTIIVEKNGYKTEITTYREDRDYADGRHPEKIVFTKSLNSDLARRDFTINALAYNPKSGIIDEFYGLKDIDDKIIKTVGDAKIRLSEDYLRIMRAIRFSAQLGFRLDKDLVEAIISLKYGLKKISFERIRDEFNKILLSENPSLGLRLLSETGVLKIISIDINNMVDFDQHSSFHDYDLFEHTLKVIENTEPKIDLRLAALFHDIGKPDTFFLDENGEGRFFGHQKRSAEIAEEFLKKYKYSNKLINKIIKLIERHMDCVNLYTHKSVKKLLSRLGDDIFHLFDLQKADILSTNRPEFIENVDNGIDLVNEIIENKLPVNKNQLSINGYDLIEIGYTEGRKIGEVLDILTEIVIEHPEKNNKKELLEIAKKLK